MSSLNGKVAVITGGNSGIGFETAKKYKALGAEVVIIGRSREKVSQAANEIGVTGLVADVQNVAAIEAAVDSVRQQFGGVDILFYQYFT